MTQLYFILSLERGAWAGSAVWWGPNHRGYTTNLNHAGLYDDDGADLICEGANAHGKMNEFKVPCEIAQGISFEVAANPLNPNSPGVAVNLSQLIALFPALAVGQ